PADSAGIKDADVIIQIDGEAAAGLSLSEAVRRIKGPKGTVVQLLVERGEPAQRHLIDVTRDKVKPITMIEYREGPIGYIRMDEFAGHTYQDLRVLLQRLKYQSDEALQGLVLDLRFNGGGRLDQAVLVSDLFLPGRREVVRTVRKGEIPEKRTTERSQLIDVPVAVLVSGGSASAAEILAGALQCNDRAVVVGQTTFGKGSVQTWRKLPDNSFIKYTIQEYQLRDGVSIQGHGVQPDVMLHRHAQREDGSIDLVPFSRMQEADEDYALIGDGSYVNDTSYLLNWYQPYEGEDQREQYRISHPRFRPDPEAQMVMDLMYDALTPLVTANAQRPVTLARQQLIAALREPVSERQHAENDRLARVFQQQKEAVVWNGTGSPLPTAEQLQLRVEQVPTAQAGEKAHLLLGLRNSGDSLAARIYGVVEADDNSPYWEAEVAFGDIAPGGERIGDLILDVPPRVYSGEEIFTVVLRQSGSPVDLGRLQVRMPITGAPRPKLDYSWELEADDRIAYDQQARLRMTIRNNGEGASAPLVLFVRKEDDPFLQLGAARWQLPALQPGAEESITVPLTVLSRLTIGDETRTNEAEQVSMSVHIEERFEDGTSHYLAERLNHQLELPIAKPVQGDLVRQPQVVIEQQSVDADGLLHLGYRVLDDNPAYIAIFVGEDKVVMRQAAHEPQRDGSYMDLLPMEAGMNDVRIVVEDADHVTVLHPLRIWSDTEATTVVVQAPATVDATVEMP
ncbi:MAG: S41 family peptidase, partial [Planctomycetota bacterium]